MISIKQDWSVHLNKNKQCFMKDHSIIWKYAYLKNQLKNYNWKLYQTVCANKYKFRTFYIDFLKVEKALSCAENSDVMQWNLFTVAG